MGEASMSKQLNRFGTENERPATEFIRAHGHSMRTNVPRLIVLLKFEWNNPTSGSG
jgi:hypothetical protein